MKQKLLRIARQFLGLFPSALPQGIQGFKEWSDSIVSTYNVPDNDSTRFALATMVLHLGPTVAFKPKFYFALSLYKSAANQVVFAVMEDLKAKQKASVAITNEIQQ